ncbi:MAG: ERF family protein [Bacteroidia bacterium]|nr:ERF family protein [Bacteroidia bacterium]
MKKSLFEAINEIKPIVKDKTNPHFRNTYADINSMLEVVKPILHKHQLGLLQPIVGGHVCSRIYDMESGEMLIESSLEMTQGLNAQQKGSEITYFRRYTLQSLLGLEAEDDDGNNGSQSKPQGNAVPQLREDVPTEWLNLFDKQGNKTDKFELFENLKNYSQGKVYTLSDIRKKYKVSKEVAAQLTQHFNIK